MTEVIKVMLASGITDYDKITYPKYLSAKLDGIRVVINNGIVYSRSGKPIRNKTVQELFGKDCLNNVDGEIIYSDPTDKLVFNLTTSAVMSAELPYGFEEHKLCLYAFDYVEESSSYTDRKERLEKICNNAFVNERINIQCIKQHKVHSHEEMLQHESFLLEQGYEGVMLRSIYGKYRHGRATEKSQDLLKVKRFVDDEAEIIGYEELMHNANEATTNELGYMGRSSHKDNLVGMNTLGALVCRTKEGVVFKIGTGYDASTRKKLWNTREILIGQLAKYKSFPVGVKDAPRLPVFLGIRDKDDL